MSDRVLITGASGFLGYHLLLSALQQNLEVFAAVRKNSKIDHLKELPIKYLFLDYDDVDSMTTLLAENKINYIIHAAGVTKAVKQKTYNDINSTYSVNLAKASLALGSPFRKMVFISSLASIGPLNDFENNITEESIPTPVTAYGRSKLLAENELAKIRIPLIILRPTAVYGPRDKDIFIMLKTVSKGFDPYIGKILQQLSFVHVSDVANVAVQSLFVINTGAYNITDGNCYSRYQFADIVKGILNKKAIRFHIPMPIIKALAYFLESFNSLINKPAVISREKLFELAATNWICDISKAKNELNYIPKYNLESGLKDSIIWYQKNKLM